MRARIPARRLGQSALAAFHPHSKHWVPSTSLSATAQRHISNPFRRKKEGKGDLRNPIIEDYLKKKGLGKGLDDKEKRPARPAIREGRLSTHQTSLFLPEREIPGWRANMSKEEEEKLMQVAEQRKAEVKRERDAELVEMSIDPAPRARRALERDLVIASVERHGRMTKAQKLMRTERQSLYKSHNLPTSVKKMQKVVNQIAGKTVSEALVQLRFSRKKVARDVIKGLEIAQDEAILTRGMGLQGGEPARIRWLNQRRDADAGSARDVWDYKISSRLGLVSEKLDEKQKTKRDRRIKTTLVELKDGSKKMVRDPWEIYIDQAWVGRGESWKTPEYRARGAVNMLTHRTTSFSVLLKEEKTRMRLSEEIKKKRDNRKLWVALPDRPVTAQRQYCLW